MFGEVEVGDRKCYVSINGEASHILIQAVDKHDLEGFEREVAQIKALSCDASFMLVAFQIADWNKELSPWEAPAVFGKHDFGAGAGDTLAYITETLLPHIETTYPTRMPKRFYLGGYSLSGLFALWAAYQTNLFGGVAGVSPSVWFPKWERLMEENTIRVPYVYLSLGDREEKTRNQAMAKVGDNIRRQYELLCRQPSIKACKLEWNPGNHFVDNDVRMAKGFAWLLRLQCGDSSAMIDTQEGGKDGTHEF